MTIGTSGNIDSLTEDNMTGVTSAQMAALKSTQVSALSSNDDLQFVTTGTLVGLTKNNIKGLDLTKLSGEGQFAALKASQIATFTTTQVASIDATGAEALTSAVLAAMKSTQIAKLSATDVLPNISPEAMAGFNAKNITGLSSTQIQNLLPEQAEKLIPAAVKSLTTAQVEGFESEDFAALTPQAVKAIKPATLAAVDENVFAALSADQIQMLSGAQMAKLTAAQVLELTPEQTEVLSPAQVAKIDSDIINQMPSESIAALPASAAAKISDLSEFTSAQVYAMTDEQMAKLSVTQLKTLSYSGTTAGIKGLSATHVGNDNMRTLSGLSSNQIQALSTNADTGAIPALTSKQMSKFTVTELSYFTPVMANSLNTDVVDWATNSKRYGVVQSATGTTSDGTTTVAGIQTDSTDIQGTTAADTITSGSNHDTISGNAGADSIDSGAGNDVIKFSSGAEISAAATISGGDGNDSITLDADGLNDITDTAFAKTTGVEIFNLGNGANGGTTEIALGANAQTAGILTINGGTGADKVSVSAYTVGVSINGGSGADIITGGTAADTITGGVGADSVTGGEGSDVFVFAAGSVGATPASGTLEAITDWNKSSDADKIDFGSTSLSFVTSSTAAATATSSIASGLATFVTADDTVDERITAAQAGLALGGTATAGQTVLFRQGSDSYVFISDGTDGVGANDVLIQLENRYVSSATITSGDLTVEAGMVYEAAAFNTAVTAGTIATADSVYVVDDLANTVGTVDATLFTNKSYLDRIVAKDTTAAAADVVELNTSVNASGTNVIIDLSDATTVSGSGTNVAAVYALPTTQIAGLANEAVTVTGTDATVANLTNINAATTGLITAASMTALSGTTAVVKVVTDEIAATGNKINIGTMTGDVSNISVTLSDANSTAITASDLNAIDAKVGTVTATNAIAISGTVAEIDTLVAGAITASTAVVTITGTGSALVTAAGTGTTYTLGTLGVASVTLDASDNVASMTATQAGVIETNVTKFAATDVITIADAFTASVDYTKFTDTNLGGTGAIVLDDSDNEAIVDITDAAAVDASDALFKSTTNITVTDAFTASVDYTQFTVAKLGGDASMVLNDDNNEAIVDITDAAAVDASDALFKSTTNITVADAFTASVDYTQFTVAKLGGDAVMVLDDSADNEAVIDITDSGAIDTADAAFKSTTNITVTDAFTASVDYSQFTVAKLGGDASMVLNDDNNEAIVDITDAAAIDASDALFKSTTNITVTDAFTASVDYAQFTVVKLGGDAAMVLNDSDNEAVIDITDSGAIDTADAAFKSTTNITVTDAFTASVDYSQFTVAKLGGDASMVLNDGDNEAIVDITDAAAVDASDALFKSTTNITVTDTFNAAVDYTQFTVAKLGGDAEMVLNGSNTATVDVTDVTDIIAADAKFISTDVITVADAFDDTMTYSNFTQANLGGSAAIELDDSDDTVSIDNTDVTNILASDATFNAANVITVADAFTAAIDYTRFTQAGLGGSAAIELDDSDDTVSIDATDAVNIDASNSTFNAANVITVTMSSTAESIDVSALGGAATSVVSYSAITGSTVGAVDVISGLTLNDATANTIDLPTVTGTLAVIASQASGVAAAGLTESGLNGLLNSSDGTLTNKFAGTNANVALLTTSDSKTFLAIDVNGSGTFTTAADMLIEITGATLTSFAATNFA